VQVSHGWMLLHGFPATAAIQLHPIVFTVFHLSRVLECLSEQISQKVIVRGVFESEVSDIAQILVKFLCSTLLARSPLVT